MHRIRTKVRTLSKAVVRGHTRIQYGISSYTTIHYIVPTSIGETYSLGERSLTVHRVLALSDIANCYNAWLLNHIARLDSLRTAPHVRSGIEN